MNFLSNKFINHIYRRRGGGAHPNATVHLFLNYNTLFLLRMHKGSKKCFMVGFLFGGGGVFLFDFFMFNSLYVFVCFLLLLWFFKCINPLKNKGFYTIFKHSFIYIVWKVQIKIWYVDKKSFPLINYIYTYTFVCFYNESLLVYK